MTTAAVVPTPTSIPADPSPTEPRRRVLLTAADLAVFPRSLPSGDVSWELRDGELLPMSPPGFRHGKVALAIGTQLLVQGEQRGHGEAAVEIAVILRRNPDHVVAPDALFLAKSSCPPQLSSEGYLLTVPELVVEVRSKNDTQPEIDAKVRDYLTAGVALVWVADPDARTVTAHRPNTAPAVFAAGDTLAADPVIPGFAVPVADLLPA